METGYQLQFEHTPTPWRTKPLRLNTEDQVAVDLAVQKFIKAGIITRSPSQSRDFLSTFFTIQEATKRRPILNCTKLNQFLQIQHFKMEGVPALRDIIEKDDFMCKVDLKDAYVVVPVHKASQKYLTFENNNIVYQYTSLAFGLSIAPRVFSKLMRYAVEHLRAKDMRLVYYLDDICVLEKSRSKMRESVQILTQHLENLGFLINREKSVLEPKKIQEFLGFQFNTQTMSISLPTHKVTKLLQRIRQTEVPVIRSCRWIASLLGKMTAVIPAIGEALLHIRHMQRDLSRSLRTHNHNWDKNCKLSAQSMEEITWWKKYLVKKNGLPIHKLLIQEPSAKFYVDASDAGWGVTSQLIQTAGFWTPAEKEQSINVRELKTIYYALLIHSKRLKHTTIKILSDNMTALKYVTKAGGTASFALQDLAVKIQDLCNLHHLTVQYQHIPGILNVTADQLSRSKKPLYESTIPKKMFQFIYKNGGKQ